MRRKGLQAWLEQGAKGPAFAIVAVCMIMRAASAYSGGAFSLAHALGGVGSAIFDMLTGIGLAVGAELLASIAGRAARRHADEAAEAAMTPGLKKWERAARIEREQRRAAHNQVFSVLGLVASIYGAFWFLWNANPHHDWLSIAGEVATTAILVTIVYYLGVIAEDVPDDPRQLAHEHTTRLQLRMLQDAGGRIAQGAASRQDVNVFAEHLPRAERSRFRAIMAQEAPHDPAWGSAQIVAWLAGTGASLEMVRKRVGRALRLAEERGQDVRRDERGAYQVPRSVALQLFASDFLELAGRADIAGTIPRQRRATGPRPAVAVRPQDTDQDATETPLASPALASAGAL